MARFVTGCDEAVAGEEEEDLNRLVGIREELNLKDTISDLCGVSYIHLETLRGCGCG